MYYKYIINGIIICIGEGYHDPEIHITITKEEYEKINEIIANRPTSNNDNFEYRLKEDLTWELYNIKDSIIIEEQSDNSISNTSNLSI